MWIIYGVIAFLLLMVELVYFKVADKYNVLRGGGIIFTIGLWIWSIVYGFQYPWLLTGVTLAAGISFVDDIHSLPDSLRLVVQFTAMFLVFYEIGVLQWSLWWLVPIALIVAVGGTNIFNFMDGINGITGGYSLAMLIPLYLLNLKYGFMQESLLIVIVLSLLVFCFFNFRTKAKCFAGDVGSIGMALVLVFCLGRLMMETGDVTWIVLYMVYGVDGCLTIVHRIMLHENLGQAHRKHVFQLMANELKIPHVVVSLIYMAVQLVISLIAIYLVPDSILAHWAYLIVAGIVMSLSYVLFKKKYYHLHEEYLAGVSPSTGSKKES